MERNLAARFRTSAKLSVDDVVFPGETRNAEAMLYASHATDGMYDNKQTFVPLLQAGTESEGPSFHLPLLFFFL